MTNEGSSVRFIGVFKIIAVVLTILLQVLLFGLATLKVHEYASYFGILVHFLAVCVSVKIVCSTGSSADKLSWVFFILVVPATGLFLYLVFGKQRFAKILSRKIISTRAKSEMFLEQNEDLLEEIDNETVKGELRLIKNTSRYPVYKNTSATYYNIGEKYFEALLEEINKAEKFIFLEYFIFADGEMYRQLFDAIGQKAKNGVDVRVIYDPAGSTGVFPKDFFARCKETGIQAKPFNPFVYNVYAYGSYRSHRKITVIDGNVGFTGGVNIGDEYINVASKLGHWKDMGIRLIGDGVFSLTTMFLDGWALVTDVEQNYADYRPTISIPESKAYVAPFDDAPLDKFNPGAYNYKKIISGAKDYLYITTPYLIIEPEMTAMLTLAAQSGVDVRIITPNIPDKRIIFESTKAHYQNLLEGGVRIYQYEPGFVHGKVLVTDDRTSFVGSINFDYRSLLWNYECGAYVYEKEFAQTVKADMLDTLSKSVEITLRDVREQPIYIKALQGVLRLISPLL